MELKYKYRQHLKEYSVEESSYNYYMPHCYILKLEEYFRNMRSENSSPVEDWYVSLSDLERRIVTRKLKDEEKVSSIW